MSNQQISKSLPSATSLQASEGGVLHCSLQGGTQADLSGQEARHANHSQQQETEKDKMMSDTYGQSSLTSLESANLQQSLASRLQQQLEQAGSTIYKLTWKQKTTPRQWPYYQLAASGLRTKESGYSSWPTPAARDYKDTGDLSKSRYRKNGKERLDTVPRIAFGVDRPSTAKTESADQYQLNPRFSLWLMGYPIEWAYCAERVTPSSRRRRQK